MSLLKLSIEPLQLITQELSIWDLSALICACKGLLHNLKSFSSVVKAKMPGYLHPDRPNRLITTFKFLLDVSIGNGGTMPRMCAGHIMYLPKTLLSLKMNFREAFGCFYRGVSDWEPISSPPPYDQYSLVQLESHLPNLRTLIVTSVDYELNPHVIIPALPSSLTSLQLQHSQRWGAQSRGMRCDCPFELPPNLTAIKLPRCTGFTEKASLSNLIYLESVSLRECGDVPMLPPSVTKLHLKALPETYELADKVPNLTSLTLRSVSLEDNFQYPSRLVTFKLPAGRLVLSAQRCTVPPTVTKLVFSEFVVIDHPISASLPLTPAEEPKRKVMWPPNLKSLQFGSSFTNSPSTFSVLPPTLEYTNLLIENLNISNLGMLPKRLVISHSIIDVSPNWLLDNQTEQQDMEPIFDMASLLPNLTQCSITSHSTGDEQPIRIVFPRTLVRLDVVSTHSKVSPIVNKAFGEINSEYWPPYLRHLTLGDNYPMTDRGLLALPRSLTALTLVNLRGDTVHPFKFTHVGLAKLPSNLTRLNILFHMETVKPDWIHHLPGFLRSLSLEHYDGIQDKHMILLPRCLTELNLTNSVALSDACLPHLPPALTSLSLRQNTCITPKILDYLPRRQPTFYAFNLFLPSNTNFPNSKKLQNLIPPTLRIKTKHLVKNF